MKWLLHLFFFATVTFGYAQVSITQDDLPAVSSFYRIASDETEIFPMPAFGADRNWNYLFFTGKDTTYFDFKPASDSPYASKYPQASLVAVDETEGEPINYFYTKGKNGLYLLDLYDAPMEQELAYNPADIVAVAPIDYGQTIRDSSCYTRTDESGTEKIFSRQTFEAVGWGSITTPAGTFANTLLVKETYSFYDVTESAPSPQNLLNSYADYLWLQKDSEMPVVFMLNIDTFGGTSGAGYFIKQLPLAVSAHNANFYRHYPVPADQHLTIEFKMPMIGTLHLLSVEGSEKLTQKIDNVSSASVNVSELPSGLYLYEIKLSDGSALQKKIVVTH